MPEIPFNGGSYQTKVTDQNAQRTINWYPVEDQRGGEHGMILMPTPGLKSPFVTLTAGSVVRGMLEHKGILYAVAADKFYSVDTNGTETERGTLNTSSGRVNLAAIDDQIMLVDGTNGYTYTVSTTTFATISDADYNDTASVVTAQDSYFLVAKPSSDAFYISDVADGTSWSATQFATAEGHWDNLVNLISYKRNLYLIGEDTTEVWFNSGATVPFERISNVFIDYGCAAQDTVALAGDSIIWLTRNRQGNSQILQVVGFDTQIISNRGIEYQISKLTTISDAFAFSYQQEGHLFYAITFPTHDITYVYDLTTDMWHERQSLDSGSQKEWRANCYAFFNGKHYVGDYGSGKVHELDTETYDEDGSAITRTRITSPLVLQDNNWLTLDRMQIDFETAVGTDIDVVLELSNDGGNTFGTDLTRTVSSSGTDYDRRAIWNRLGTHRNTTFKLTSSENARLVVLGAYAVVSGGGE